MKESYQREEHRSDQKKGSLRHFQPPKILGLNLKAVKHFASKHMQSVYRFVAENRWDENHITLANALPFLEFQLDPSQFVQCQSRKAENGCNCEHAHSAAHGIQCTALHSRATRVGGCAS